MVSCPILTAHSGRLGDMRIGIKRHEREGIIVTWLVTEGGHYMEPRAQRNDKGRNRENK